MAKRDGRPEERRRPTGPAWATVPTTQWRVVPSEPTDPAGEDEAIEVPAHIAMRRTRSETEGAAPVSPAVVPSNAPLEGTPHLGRGRARPVPPRGPYPEHGAPDPALDAMSQDLGYTLPARGLGSPAPAPAPRPFPSRAPRPGMPGTRGWTRADLPPALTAPTPPGGLPTYPADTAVPAASLGTAPPLSSPTARPVSSAPISAPPISAPPISAPPISGIPLSGPVSGAPLSGLPVSGAPVSAAPVSASPFSDLPVSAPPEADPAGSDPEHVLATWNWRFDPETLREVVDDEEKLRDLREQLTTKLNTLADNASRARLLSLRAVVSRILGDLVKALADGKLALAHAENTGELRRIAIAQARLAHVHQWRGEFEEADRLFTLANSTELPDRLRASMNQHAGRCAYDQGRYIEACNHFDKALELRKEEDPELIAQTELALDAVFRRMAAGGVGPYPRSREEILQIRRPPTPALDEVTGLWGYTDADGATCVAADFADVQPFKDGVAWVLRPGQQQWELIDERGLTLIPARAGYLGVSSFSDGLAWVSRDGNSRWTAIDKSNSVTISTGFHDVRPFRRGMAAVCRDGRWGAVDGVGRVIVPFAYDAFATAMHDGRYIDGFSDEGLAVVELDGRKGVVDRAGRVLIEPAYPLLVIHPVAFLITDRAHRWGALDRHGRLLITPSHPSRMGVADEIDRLLADARPVL
jgi:hypothetical protein